MMSKNVIARKKLSLKTRLKPVLLVILNVSQDSNTKKKKKQLKEIYLQL